MTIEPITEVDIWKGQKWWDIELGAYEIFLKAVKARFEDTISESESLTNKSLQMLALAPLLGGLIISKISNSGLNGCIVYAGIGIAIVLLGALYNLIAPKDVFRRGVGAESLVPPNLVRDGHNGIQTLYAYYSAITTIAQNTNKMEALNGKRMPSYKVALACTIILLGLAAYLLTKSFVALR